MPKGGSAALCPCRGGWGSSDTWVGNIILDDVFHVKISRFNEIDMSSIIACLFWAFQIKQLYWLPTDT